VTRANLVSLQARMNYFYIKPSVVEQMPEHWAWVFSFPCGSGCWRCGGGCGIVGGDEEAACLRG
jgi:hypothetical protein